MMRQLCIGSQPIKVKAPKRAPDSVLRRTDFNYMEGHGTFYQFDKEHFPKNLLNAKPGDRLSVVLYNLHTDQLDEVVFKLEGYSEISEKCTWVHGYIDNIKDCFRIKFRYYLDRPLESQILVYASAPPAPGYDFLWRL